MTLTRETALQELCDEQWDAIDREVAEVVELPAWETSEACRQRVFREFHSYPRVSSYDARNASDRHILAPAFRRHAVGIAKATADALIYAVVHMDTRTLNRIRRKVRVTRVPKAQDKRPARLQKADAANLELLSFVVERIIPFGQLLRERLDKDGRDIRLLPGHRGPKVSVPRQALAKEWNRTHPHAHDSMSSGNVLMGQYYRAAARPHLCNELLTQLRREVDEAWEDYERRLERLRQSYAGLTEEERAKYFESPIQISEKVRRAMRESQQRFEEAQHKYRAALEILSPEEREAAEKASAQREGERIRRERDAIPRTDLIEHRVFRLVWRIPGEDPGKDQQLWQSPLRDWFLPEARGEHVPYLTGQYDTMEKWRNRKADRLREAQPESSHSKATRRPASAKSTRAAKKSGQQKRRPAGTQKKAPRGRTSQPSR